jgi:hypothetical protein
MKTVKSNQDAKVQRLTEAQIENLISLGYSKMIIAITTPEIYQDTVNKAKKATAKAQRKGKASGLLQSVDKGANALLGTEKEVIVNKEEVIAYITNGQIGNFFESFTLNDEPMTPETLQDVYWLKENGAKITLPKGRLENNQVMAVPTHEGKVNLVYDLFAKRGKAVLNSHVITNGMASQYNANKYSCIITEDSVDTLKIERRS